MATYDDREPDSTEETVDQAAAALRAEGLASPTMKEQWESVLLAKSFVSASTRWREALRLAAISVVGYRRIKGCPSPYGRR